MIWIAEPVTDHDRSVKAADDPMGLNISPYSKLLTKRFQAKGLVPCLRKVHPAVELSADVIFVEPRDSEQFKMYVVIYVSRDGVEYC
jgi:hypothetical protein